jgi:diaminopimelate epimerase
MKFTKLQATGNDFVLIEADRMRRDWGKLSQIMCDRRFGIGSDGLILLLKSKAADFRMRMFNPDGSEAEVCGNGLRCFARYVVSTGLADTRRSMTIETSAGVKTAVPRDRGLRFEVDMGRPGFRPGDLPVAVTAKRVPIMDHPVTVAGQKLRLTFVSMGNPHAVHFLPDVGNLKLCDIGPRVENHALFPRRVNFEIAHVVSRREIQARVWERGAGETLSCGTGACAIAVASRLHDYVDSPVDIKLPGGTLSVKWDRKGSVCLTGPAELVFNGDWPDRKPSEEK